MSKERYRSLFVSDLHLGCKYVDAKGFYNFLDGMKAPEYLYLVGDIIDGWRLQRCWHWENKYNQIAQKILAFAKKGTKVFYIPGNHDEFMRGWQHEFGNVIVTNEAVHRTVDGLDLLVLHGDIFDSFIRCAKWVSLLGDVGYNLLLMLNSYFNEFRRRMGLRYWSLSKYVKENVKRATCYITSFEEQVAKYTRDKSCSGVVCGHIHTPKIEVIEDITYYNCGDWVENSTALVEHFDGKLELVRTK